MGQLLKTNQIVSKFEQYWVASTGGQFHFGTPQDVDNIHNKTLPLMLCYSPDTTIATQSWNKNTILAQTNWTIVVYNVLPSQYNVTDDTAILTFWDTMEDTILDWFNIWFYHFETQGQNLDMTAPLQITRLKESSNDRLLSIKVTFGFNFYRYCIEV